MTAKGTYEAKCKHCLRTLGDHRYPLSKRQCPSDLAQTFEPLRPVRLASVAHLSERKAAVR